MCTYINWIHDHGLQLQPFMSLPSTRYRAILIKQCNVKEFRGEEIPNPKLILEANYVWEKQNETKHI